MRKVSAVLFSLWTLAAMVQVYTGPDTWRSLLNAREKILLPLLVISGYYTLWAAAGLCGSILSRLFTRVKPGASALFMRIALILTMEVFWFFRSVVLTARPMGSPGKIAVLAAVAVFSILIARFIVRAVPELPGGGGADIYSVVAGLTVILFFVTVAHYSFIENRWSFHLEESVFHSQDKSSMPNLVIVTLDTTSANYAGRHGDKKDTTPVMTALAERGASLDNAIAPMPVTGPSHSSIMTGLIPRVHGVIDNDSRPLGERFVTLAEILSGKGMKTA